MSGESNQQPGRTHCGLRRFILTRFQCSISITSQQPDEWHKLVSEGAEFAIDTASGDARNVHVHVAWWRIMINHIQSWVSHQQIGREFHRIFWAGRNLYGILRVMRPYKVLPETRGCI
jgi:hypothetical protein